MTVSAPGVARSGPESAEKYAQALGAMRGDLSVRAFATEVGVDPSTISRLLRPGERPITPSTGTHRRLAGYARSRGLQEQLQELEDAWQALAGGPPESKFERVFGREIAQGQVALVFPVYRLDETVLRDDVLSGSAEDVAIYRKIASGEPAGIGYDVDNAALRDLRGLLDVVGMLASNAPGAGRLEGDVAFCSAAGGQFSTLPESAFLFGLYSNDITGLYNRQATNPLFDVVRPGQDGSPGEIVVGDDRFRNPAPSDYPTFFVIARVLPNPADMAERVCIICAGTNAAGTHGAGRYLREDWEWFSRFASDTNFAAIYRLDSEHADPVLELAVSKAAARPVSG